MKRTTITAAACGMAVFAAACAPQDTTGSAADAPSPDSGVTSVERTTQRGTSAPEKTAPETSAAPSEALGDVPSTPSHTPSAEETTGSAAASSGTAGTSQSSAPASRSADGRARIGDPCPGLTGALRPAVNGENLVCAGGPVPRWTVILDEPAPEDPTEPTGVPTEEPGEAGGDDDARGTTGVPRATAEPEAS